MTIKYYIFLAFWKGWMVSSQLRYLKEVVLKDLRLLTSIQWFNSIGQHSILDIARSLSPGIVGWMEKYGCESSM